MRARFGVLSYYKVTLLLQQYYHMEGSMVSERAREFNAQLRTPQIFYMRHNAWSYLRCVFLIREGVWPSLGIARDR